MVTQRLGPSRQPHQNSKELVRFRDIVRNNQPNTHAGKIIPYPRMIIRASVDSREFVLTKVNSKHEDGKAATRLTNQNKKNKNKKK